VLRRRLLSCGLYTVVRYYPRCRHLPLSIGPTLALIRIVVVHCDRGCDEFVIYLLDQSARKADRSFKRGEVDRDAIDHDELSAESL
jgi:hypothetical protein